MTTIDLAHLRQWVGRAQVDEDLIATRHARLMAATVGHPVVLADGMPLPALWHWLYFLDGLPAGELGRDGHPARGGFLPPVPLPNRMWAGGRLRMLQPILLGSRVRRESTVLRVDHKQGRRGDLIFVTVQHELKSPDGTLLLHEEHDIVYKDRTQGGVAVSPTVPPGPQGIDIVPDAVMLFRYSALTFNGHRIHYDLDYCRRVEGYDNLVIHGPLLATLLANHAEARSGRCLSRFDYRLLAPACVGSTLTMVAGMSGDKADDLADDPLVLRMLRDGGQPCAEAMAYFAP